MRMPWIRLNVFSSWLRVAKSLWARTITSQAAEDGQALIQFAFVVSGILVVAGLSIDGGYVYSQRRVMQNAADAAALAGARELCLMGTETAATTKANLLLVANGVESGDILAGDVDVDGHIVRVTARMEADTYLSALIGVDTVPVAADSAAACGAATQACGLWPMTFELALWEQVACGQALVLWDADKDNDAAACKINGVDKPVCNCYDCDLDNNGQDDFAVMTGLSRGWLDFTGVIDPAYPDSCDSNGCGNSELCCRIRNDSSTRITLPACIPGLRGVKAGAKDDVNSRAGDDVTIPLFTSLNCPTGSHCSGTDAESYYVTRFGCATVVGWNHNFELNPLPGMPKSYKKIKTKTIMVTKNCSGDCTSECGSTDGSAPDPWEVKAVRLTR